ncbi:MAG: DUF1824 family protein [Chroococcales cyanobacterium]
MSTQASNTLSLEEARNILRQYSCIQLKVPESEPEKEQLRQAVLLITSLSESENLGVCADNPAQGFAALESYLKALGYEVNFDQNATPTLEDPVYIKFNTEKQRHLIDSYTGGYRGVLISCQSENDQVAGTYGHLPLDLFI